MLFTSNHRPSPGDGVPHGPPCGMLLLVVRSLLVASREGPHGVLASAGRSGTGPIDQATVPFRRHFLPVDERYSGSEVSRQVSRRGGP